VADKTHNRHNSRWGRLRVLVGRRLHSSWRAFEKITSSGCLFAFGYLEDERSSSAVEFDLPQACGSIMRPS
jgi:hypothetical protein